MSQFYSNRIKVQRTPPKGGFHTLALRTEVARSDLVEICLAWTNIFK